MLTVYELPMCTGLPPVELVYHSSVVLLEVMVILVTLQLSNNVDESDPGGDESQPDT